MAKLFPWDPWLELHKEDMGRLMDDSACPSPFQSGKARAAHFQPVADVIEYDTEFRLVIELPGMTRDDVSLEMLDNELVVFGERGMRDVSGATFQVLERSYGCFARRFPLPVRIDAHGVKAIMKDGLLTVTIPKLTPNDHKKRITLTVDG